MLDRRIGQCHQALCILSHGFRSRFAYREADLPAVVERDRIAVGEGERRRISAALFTANSGLTNALNSCPGPFGTTARTDGGAECQIALAGGLADQAHLSKLFRNLMGESPSAWRRRALAEANGGANDRAPCEDRSHL